MTATVPADALTPVASNNAARERPRIIGEDTNRSHFRRGEQQQSDFRQAGTFPNGNTVSDAM